MFEIHWKNWEELQIFLNHLSQQLSKLGHKDLARLVSDASSYYGLATPGEFMGESWIALKEVYKKKDQLPVELLKSIDDMMNKIKQGYKAVGQEIE